MYWLLGEVGHDGLECKLNCEHVTIGTSTERSINIAIIALGLWFPGEKSWACRMIKKSHHFTMGHLSGKNAKSFLFKGKRNEHSLQKQWRIVHTYKYSQ